MILSFSLQLLGLFRRIRIPILKLASCRPCFWENIFPPSQSPCCMMAKCITCNYFFFLQNTLIHRVNTPTSQSYDRHRRLYHHRIRRSNTHHWHLHLWDYTLRSDPYHVLLRLPQYSPHGFQKLLCFFLLYRQATLPTEWAATIGSHGIQFISFRWSWIPSFYWGTSTRRSQWR